MYKRKLILMSLASLAFILSACAGGTRGDSNSISSSSTALETAQQDVVTMEATADAIISDASTLVTLTVPEPDCSGETCTDIANSCSIFNRSSVLVAS